MVRERCLVRRTVGVLIVIPNPCCCSCVLYNDLFSSSLASEWEQVAGSWSTSAGVLTTSSASAMVIHETESPNTAGRVVVTRTGTSISPGTAVWYLIGAYKDANNYLYLKVEYNGSTYTFTLGYLEAGVDTVLSTDSGLSGAGGVDVYWRLCWDGTRAVGGFANDSLTGAFTPVTGGNRAGFATGASGTSWAWPDFDFSYHREERGNCPTCGTCWDSCETFPDEIEVYIPAGTFTSRTFTGTGWFCNGGCEALNDQTFVLSLADIPNFACPRWEYVEEDFCSIESPAAPGFPYLADLAVRVTNLTFDDTGETVGDGRSTRWKLSIEIASVCVAFSHGNITRWGFDADDRHPDWSPCVELEYETTLGTTNLACNTVQIHAACTIDSSKKPTINFV